MMMHLVAEQVHVCKYLVDSSHTEVLGDTKIHSDNSHYEHENNTVTYCNCGQKLVLITGCENK